jgi:hypothetical protein
MLKEIAIVTIIVTNLSQVETAWREYFGYKVADRGEVSEQLADVWDADAMEGMDYITMQPSNDAPVYVRFVEDELAAGYTAMTTHGWNATELLVKDPDALAKTIEGNFDIVGAPKDLWAAPNAPRAMQAVGPAGELLYLTRNGQAAATLGLDDSMPDVERAFIMVLGGPSMQDFQRFYGDTLGLTVGDAMSFQLSTFSRINELPVDTTYPLAIINTAPGYMIEIDELPASLPKRKVAAEHLPPGIAIVGFNSAGITAELEWVSEPEKLNEFPYHGAKVGLLRGPAGELVEVIVPAEL